MLNRFLFLVICAFSFGFSQSDDSLQVYYHDEIVISATKYPKPVSDIARSISVIEKQQIDNKNNYLHGTNDT